MYQGIPVGGYTEMVRKMLLGIEVRLGKDFFANRKEWETKAYKIIYSGPLDEFYDCCYGKLEYTTLRYEEEVLELPDYQGNAVVYYTSDDVPYTRIIEHKYFEAPRHRQQMTYVYDEPRFQGSPVPQRTVITREYSQEFHKGMEPLYPVNDKYNEGVAGLYMDKAKKENRVFIGGRLGSYKYYNMAEVIKEAMELVRGI